jgi:DNA-binding NarL/FixJ family response regulator
MFGAMGSAIGTLLGKTSHVIVKANTGTPKPRKETVMGKAQLFRALIVDDCQIVRRGIRAVLQEEPGCEVMGEAAEGFDALKKAEDLQPDVVWLDISLPELNGLSAAYRIRQVAPKSEILFVSYHDSPEVVCEAFKAGARGFICKSDLAHELVGAVRAIGRKEIFLTQTVAHLRSRLTEIPDQPMRKAG